MSFLTTNSFVFNNKNSLDFNMSVGWMDNTNINVGSNGLNREIKKTLHPNKIKSTIYNTENTDLITFNFNIYKITGEEITRPESIKINEWLTSSSLPQKLQFNDEDSYPLHYYAVCTNIKDITAGSRLISKELTFETNSSYAFTEKTVKTYTVQNNLTFSINNSADTYDGIYYPVITITAVSGNIVIENITDKRSITLSTQDVIADESGNKIIKLNSDIMTVLDKDNNLIPAYKLGWDKAYKSHISSTNSDIDNIYWPRFLQGINQFKVTGSCTLQIEYEYPKKAGCL